MNDYRPLTTEEIEVLKHNDCWAEDWTSVNVSEDFKPNFMHRVMLYGEINIVSFNKNVKVNQGFVKHSGINNATLRNVTIGDDCLIENVGNFINNYTIGDDCYISNISTLETTEGATYGEGNLVSVLNEVGEGNVILFSDLNSQLAAFMVKYFPDKEMKEKIRQLIKTDIENKAPERGQIGSNVKIVNTKEITNCVINDLCEVNGASRLSDCTLLGSVHGNVYVGTGVIIENSIIAEGSSVINSVKMRAKKKIAQAARRPAGVAKGDDQPPPAAESSVPAPVLLPARSSAPRAITTPTSTAGVVRKNQATG